MKKSKKIIGLIGLILLLFCGISRAPTLSMRSFNAGEWSPRLEGRQDIAKYYSAARTVENLIPVTMGPVKKRSGTYYIGTAAGTARLVEFEYTSEGGGSRILEFSDKAMRVFK